MCVLTIRSIWLCKWKVWSKFKGIIAVSYTYSRWTGIHRNGSYTGTPSRFNYTNDWKSATCNRILRRWLEWYYSNKQGLGAISRKPSKHHMRKTFRDRIQGTRPSWSCTNDEITLPKPVQFLSIKITLIPLRSKPTSYTLVISSLSSPITDLHTNILKELSQHKHPKSFNHFLVPLTTTS